MATYDDAFLNQLFGQRLSQYGAMPVATDPLNRTWAYTHLIPQDIDAYQSLYRWNPGAAPRGGWDGEGNWTGFSDTEVQGDKYARELLGILDAYGVNSTAELPAEVRAQLPNQGLYQGRGHLGSLGQQFVDYITSPPVLLALGAGAGMYAGAGSAGAGAAEGASVTGASGELAAGGAASGGASAGTGAAAGTAAGTESAALGSGISAEAGGASGLSTTAGGASGITATSANTAGTSLGSGYYAGETATGLSTLSNSGGSGGTGGGQTTNTTTPEQQTALQRILAGNGTAADYMTLFGQVAPALLGAYASDRQADKLGEQAARYEAMGAPYRDRLSQLYSDPTAFLKSPEVQVPVQQGTDALARALSTQGNPAGSGTALQEIQNYSTNQLFGRLGQEKDRLGGFGGLTAYNQAAPQAATNAINAQRGYYDALGYGIGQVTSPPRSLEDMLKAYNIQQGLA